MIHKKASSLTITVLVTGVIAIFVALIVISGVADPIINRMRGILPLYNNSKPPAQLPGEIRYNIQTGQVQYIDQTGWKWFPDDWNKDVEFGDKITDAKTITSDFETYYYDSSDRGPAEFQFKARRDVPGGIFIEKDGKGIYVRTLRRPTQGLPKVMGGAVVMGAIFDKEPDNKFNLLEERYYIIDAMNYFYRQSSSTTAEGNADYLITSTRNNREGMSIYDAFYPTRDKILISDSLRLSQDFYGELQKHLLNLHEGQVDPKFRKLDIDQQGYLKKPLKQALLDAGVFHELDMNGTDGTTYYFKQIKFADETDSSWNPAVWTKDEDGVAVYQASLGGYGGGLIPINVYAIVSGHNGRAISGMLFWGASGNMNVIETESNENPVSSQPSPGGEQEIFNAAIKWRDLIFQQPMKVDLFNKKDNPDAGTTCWLYRVEKTTLEGNPYLFINLRSPVEKCKTL